MSRPTNKNLTNRLPEVPDKLQSIDEIKQELQMRQKIALAEIKQEIFYDYVKTLIPTCSIIAATAIAMLYHDNVSDQNSLIFRAFDALMSIGLLSLNTSEYVKKKK